MILVMIMTNSNDDDDNDNDNDDNVSGDDGNYHVYYDDEYDNGNDK